jgi:hypothetical protein
MRRDRVRRHVRLRWRSGTSTITLLSRSLTHPAGNLNNKPAARNDHAAQPETELAPNRFALKPLALGYIALTWVRIRGYALPGDWGVIGGTSVDTIELSVKLASQAAGHALLAAGIPGGEVAVEALLNAVFQIQDQQAQALARIEAGVELLLESPWQTARQYITEAGVQRISVETRRKKLESAAEKLHDAISNRKYSEFP